MLDKAGWRPSAAGETPTSKDQYSDPVGVLRVLRRRWAVIASMEVFAIVVATLYVATTSQRYTASSLLLFNVRAAETFQQRDYPNAAADSAYVDSQVEVLKSEAIAKSVVRNLTLVSDPEFISPAGILRRISNAIIGLGTELNEEGRSVAALQSNLTIKRIGSTYVVQIDYRSLDANKAARISNAVSEAYLVDQRASKYNFSHDIEAWVRDRLADLKARA